MIGTVCALILSYIFVTAALHKWRAPEEFAVTLENYGILPSSWLRPAAWIIPVMEMLVGVSLLAPSLASSGASAAVVILSAYGIGIAVNLARGRRSMDCGCGGPGQSQMLSEWLLLRNALLAALAIVAVVASSGALAWYEWAIALPAAVTGCLIYNIGNQLLVNKDLLANLRTRNG